MRSWILLAAGGLVGTFALLSGCGRDPGEREFDAGLRELRRGEYVRAADRFEKSVNRRPASEENALAYNYLGVIRVRLGQIERAIEAFEYSRRLNPNFAAPACNLGILMLRGGDAPRALAYFDEAARLDAADARPLEFIGQYHLAERNWSDARRALFGALARAPQSARILTALAVIELNATNADKAIFYLMQALEKQPDYPPALYNLGLVYGDELKDPKQAEAYFQRFLDVAGDGFMASAARRRLAELNPPPRPPPITPSPPAAAPTAAIPMPPPLAPATPVTSAPPAAPVADDGLAAARAAADQGQVRQAMELYRAAAEQAARGGDEAARERILREQAQRCFDQSRAHYELARCLLERGRVADALAGFKQALTLDPKSTVALLGLAETAVQEGEYDTALVALKQAVQAEPNNPDPLWQLAEVYDTAMGVADKAAMTYRQFEKLFPGDPRVVKASARVEVLDPPATPPPPPPPPAAPVVAAAPTAVVAAATAPPSPGTGRRLELKKPLLVNTEAAVKAYNRGTIYQEKEDWDRAIYFYTRAVENDDHFANAFFNLGTVYWAKNDLDLAQDAYERALAIRGDMIGARFNLALLHQRLGRDTAAIEQLRTILKIQPNYPPAYALLGMLYAADERTQAEARQAYQRFLELAPDAPEAAAARAWLSAH